MEKEKLTDAKVKMYASDSGRREVWDTQVPRLVIRIGITGKKVWYLRATGHNRKRIGVFQTANDTPAVMGVAEARSEAVYELAALGQKGRDKKAEADIRAIPRLDDWWDRFSEANPGRWVESTMINHTQRMRDYISPRMGSLKIHEIRSADLEDMTLAVDQGTGARTANMCRALVLQLLKWASDREIMPSGWTAPVCRPAEENPPRVDNHIPAHKAADFLRAVDALRSRHDPPAASDITMADVILMALFTGQRKGNVKAMRWDQITGDLWTIPISEYKTRRKVKMIQPVPLTSHAMDIIHRRGRGAGTSPWVFPSPVGDGPVKKDRRPWAWVTKKAGLEHVTFHGLRHTLGTWQGEAGTNQKMIAASLGHRTTKMTERYVHSDVETVRANMSRAIDASFEVVADDRVSVALTREQWADILTALGDCPLADEIKSKSEPPEA